MRTPMRRWLTRKLSAELAETLTREGGPLAERARAQACAERTIAGAGTAVEAIAQRWHTPRLINDDDTVRSNIAGAGAEKCTQECLAHCRREAARAAGIAPSRWQRQLDAPGPLVGALMTRLATGRWEHCSDAQVRAERALDKAAKRLADTSGESPHIVTFAALRAVAALPSTNTLGGFDALKAAENLETRDK